MTVVGPVELGRPVDWGGPVDLGDQLSSLVWSGLVWLEQFRTLKAISGWMDGMGWDGWILLRTLVQLEHLAVLKKKCHFVKEDGWQVYLAIL